MQSLSPKQQNIPNAKGVESQQSPFRNWITNNWLSLLIALAAIGILAVTAYGLITSAPDRANVIVLSILSIVSLTIVIVNAVSTVKIARIMEGQEFEMTEQRKAMWEQLRAMKTQADRAAIADRAYFGITPMGIENVRGELRVGFTFTNGGRTPARDFRAAANITLRGPLSFRWNDDPSALQRSSYIPATTSKNAKFNAGFYEKSVWLEIIAGREVQVDGECRYFDHTNVLQCLRFGFTLEYNKIDPSKSGYAERYQEHYEPQDAENTK